MFKVRVKSIKNKNSFFFILDEKLFIEHQIISILQQIGMNQYLFKFFVQKYLYQLLMNNGIHHFGVHGCFYLLLYVLSTTESLYKLLFN
jgi:hypothetical protein